MLIVAEVGVLSGVHTLSYYLFVIRVTNEQNFLVLHLRRSGYQFTVLHSLGGDEFAGDLMNLVGAAADHYDLQAIVFIKVNVQTRVYSHLGFMLHIS